MNNLSIERINNMTEEELVKREMGELELYGAMLYLHQLTTSMNMNHHGESFTTIDDIDSDCYYCDKRLEASNGGFVVEDSEGKLIAIDCVFMLEGNRHTLWGYACEYDDRDLDEPEMFLIRI